MDLTRNGDIYAADSARILYGLFQQYLGSSSVPGDQRAGRNIAMLSMYEQMRSPSLSYLDGKILKMDLPATRHPQDARYHLRGLSETKPKSEKSTLYGLPARIYDLSNN